MPENSVYYYNDDHNEDYSADKPEAEEKNKKQHENDRSISQHKNDARDGAILTIVFVSLLAALLLGSVVYSLDRRNTMYNKVATHNNALELTKAENVDSSLSMTVKYLLKTSKIMPRMYWECRR